jgi:hypothetical protein
MLTGLPGTRPPAVPGALEDDPLTSPSFSLPAGPATDSRSYGHARKASRAGASAGNGSGPLADPFSTNGASHAGGHDSGGYPPADYANPAYTYPAEPAPVQAAPAVPAEWYSSPPVDSAPTPAYGNPYNYLEATPTGSPAGDPAYAGYLADPLRVYSPPPYESPVSAYPDPSGTAYPAVPDPGMAAPAMGPASGPAYPEAYPEQPYGQAPGQPEPPQYGSLNGYAPSYDSGYGGDPYAADGYGPYQPQG